MCNHFFAMNLSVSHQRCISLLVAVAAGLGGAWGCAGRQRRTTTRVIDGRAQPSRYVSPNAYANYLRARLHLGRGHLRVAAKYLRAALAFDEQSPFLHTQLARVLYRLEKRPEARDQVRRALALRRDFPDALLLSGDLATRAGHHRRAARAYRAAIAAAPSSALAYQRYAGLLERKLRKPREAIGVLEKLVARTHGRRGRRRLAQLCARRLKLSCAAEQLRALLADKSSARLTLRLAQVERARGKYAAAEKLLRRLFDRTDGNSGVARQLLEVLALRGNRRAIDDLLGVARRQAADAPQELAQVAALALSANRAALALELLQQTPAGRTNPLMASALFRNGRREQAKQLVSRLAAERTGPAAALRLARELHREGSHAAAAAALEQCRKHHRENVDLVIALSRARYLQGKATQAIDVVRAALRKKPDGRRLQLGLAIALTRAGRWREALDYARKLVERHPDDPAAHNLIGYTLVEQHRALDEAERAIRHALRLRPLEGYVVDSLGWLYFRRGQLARAARLLRIAMRLAPRDAEIISHLAETDASLQKLPRALKLFRRAIKLSDDEQLRRRWRARVERLQHGRVGTR